MPGEDPYQLSTQPLEIGRQKNIGDAGAGMRHELAGELCDEREIFVQAPGERRGGLVVAGIDGGEEEPEQRTADRLQGLGHTGAFLEQDAPRIALALQQLGRERGAHFGGQVRLRVPPNCIPRDAEALRHGPLRKPGGNREINLRARRMIADRAAQPDGPLHRAILRRSWRLCGEASRDAGQLAPVPLFSTRAEAKEFEPSKPA